MYLRSWEENFKQKSKCTVKTKNPTKIRSRKNGKDSVEQGPRPAKPKSQVCRGISSLPVTDSQKMCGWATLALTAAPSDGEGEGKRKCQKIKPWLKGIFFYRFPGKLCFILQAPLVMKTYSAFPGWPSAAQPWEGFLFYLFCHPSPEANITSVKSSMAPEPQRAGQCGWVGTHLSLHS